MWPGIATPARPSTVGARSTKPIRRSVVPPGGAGARWAYFSGNRTMNGTLVLES
jgi:hypothetical protein